MTPFSNYKKLTKQKKMPYEYFYEPDKFDFSELPPYEAFFRNGNPPDKDFFDYEKLRKRRLDEQQALKKFQIKTLPPFGLSTFYYLQDTWQQNGITVFKDFLQWCNIKDVVQNLENKAKKTF